MSETNLEERVLNLPNASQLFYNQQMAQANKNVFTAIKDLRKAFSEGAVEPEYREAANLALVAMDAHLAGEQPRQKTDDEAVSDLLSRIEVARAAGDRPLYDSLRAGFAHAAEKKIAADALHETRLAALEKNQQAFAQERADNYQAMLTQVRDAELLGLQNQGMSYAKAEAYYDEHKKASMEASVQRYTSYTPPREEIPVE